MCLIEGTNLSEGRGTALPFEIVGAPWLDGHELAWLLNQLELPGVRFRPLYFIPSASKHAGRKCGGAQVHAIDRETFRPVNTGLHVVAACRAQAPEQFDFFKSSWEGRPPHFDLLAGVAAVRKGLAAGKAVNDIMASWSNVESQDVLTGTGALLSQCGIAAASSMVHE